MIVGAQTVALGEVADALAPHRARTCAVAVEHDDGDITLTVRIASNAWEPYGLPGLELAQALARLADMGQLRALSARYSIPAGALEALLPKKEE